MGKRHNRRRSRHRLDNLRPPQVRLGYANCIPPTAGIYKPPQFSPATFASQDRMPVLPAQHWHNRYAACEPRERWQQNAMTKLELEQCRLFGGEPGDDVALCYRMLEYFGGLDYIDT